MNTHSDYSDLPMILIKKTPFPVYCPSSFGLAAYARDTQRWFFVKDRHSYGFRAILKGSYQDAMLPNLVAYMTLSELSKLKSSMYSFEKFFDLTFETFQTVRLDEVKYAFSRVSQSRKMLKRCFRNIKAADDTNWTWTKGQKNTDGSETALMAAVREFEEESGIEISQFRSSILPEPVTYTHTGTLGRNFNTVLWICIFESEPGVSPPTPLNVEVCERRWMCQHEVNRLLAADLLDVFVQIQVKLQRHLSLIA